MRGFHGELDYMTRHGRKRSRPAELWPGTLRVISARMDYLRRYRHRCPQPCRPGARLHRALRTRPRLSQDTAPATAEARRPHQRRSSAAQLPRVHRQRTGDGETTGRSGRARLDRQAHQPDQSQRRLLVSARRDLHRPAACQSTHRPAITAAAARPASTCAPHRRSSHPICWMPDAASPTSRSKREDRSRSSFRAPMGNRIFGCDDCQLVCPWNKFARPGNGTGVCRPARPGCAGLIDLFCLDRSGMEQTHRRQRLAATRLRRLAAEHRGGARQRTDSAGPGCTGEPGASHPLELVREHVAWALAQHAAPAMTDSDARPAGCRSVAPGRGVRQPAPPGAGPWPARD